MSEPTRPPFVQTPAVVKQLIDHPTIKTFSWLFSKVGWLILIWCVWSLKQYGHEYVAETPIVVAHQTTISSLVVKTGDIDKQLQKATDQTALLQSNQIAINQSLEKINENIRSQSALINAMQTTQAVLDVRVDTLERVSRRTNN